jgi:hypothetical protein
VPSGATYSNRSSTVNEFWVVLTLPVVVTAQVTFVPELAAVLSTKTPYPPFTPEMTSYSTKFLRKPVLAVGASESAKVKNATIKLLFSVVLCEAEPL